MVTGQAAEGQQLVPSCPCEGHFCISHPVIVMSQGLPLRAHMHGSTTSLYRAGTPEHS